MTIDADGTYAVGTDIVPGTYSSAGRKRLDIGVDHDGYQSADFLAKNLPRGTTTEQTWQFFATAINFYCPDLTTLLAQAATPVGTGR